MTTEKKKTPTWVWVLLCLVGLPMAMCTGLGVVGAIVAASDPTISGASAGAPTMTATARELLGAYRENEVRADATYKGEVVRVKGGIVENIKKDIADKPYVTLGTGAPAQFVSIQCSLSKEGADQAAHLSRGQEATVVGKVTGLLVNVQLSGCTVE